MDLQSFPIVLAAVFILSVVVLSILGISLKSAQGKLTDFEKKIIFVAAAGICGLVIFFLITSNIELFFLLFR